MERDDIIRAIARTEAERGILAKETEVEQTRFAREILGGLGEKIKAWEGNEAKPIRVGIWRKLRMWAKRVMN